MNVALELVRNAPKCRIGLDLKFGKIRGDPYFVTISCDGPTCQWDAHHFDSVPEWRDMTREEALEWLQDRSGPDMLCGLKIHRTSSSTPANEVLMPRTSPLEGWTPPTARS